MRDRAVLVAALVGLAACVGTPARDSARRRIEITRPAPHDTWPALREFARDAAARRRTLEDALVARDRGYGTRRLARYEVAGSPWTARRDPPAIALLSEANREAFARGDDPAELVAPFPVDAPEDASAARALGARAFRSYPLAIEPAWELVADDPEAMRRLGVQQTRHGEWLGLVLVATGDGFWHTAYTCSLCHASVDARGDERDDLANRSLDFGSVLARADPSNGPGVRRWSRWGAGRVDVTDDDNDDPLRIPSLAREEGQGFLHSSCALRATSPRALAMRIDTLWLDAERAEFAPHAAIPAAVAEYLLHLADDSPRAAASVANDAHARAVFDEHCSGCHEGAARGGARCVDAASAGTDPRASASLDRGTGAYRASSLAHLDLRGPFMHDGSFASLADVVANTAIHTRRGVHSIGAHGDRLVARDVADLVDWISRGCPQ